MVRLLQVPFSVLTCQIISPMDFLARKLDRVLVNGISSVFAHTYRVTVLRGISLTWRVWSLLSFHSAEACQPIPFQALQILQLLDKTPLVYEDSRKLMAYTYFWQFHVHFAKKIVKIKKSQRSFNIFFSSFGSITGKGYGEDKGVGICSIANIIFFSYC